MNEGIDPISWAHRTCSDGKDCLMTLWLKSPIIYITPVWLPPMTCTTLHLNVLVSPELPIPVLLFAWYLPPSPPPSNIRLVPNWGRGGLFKCKQNEKQFVFSVFILWKTNSRFHWNNILLFQISKGDGRTCKLATSFHLYLINVSQKE